MKWEVYKWLENDLLDSDGYLISKKGWYSIGTYNDLSSCEEIIHHQIYLYNCTCEDDTPLPKYKIESVMEDEEEL